MNNRRIYFATMLALLTVGLMGLTSCLNNDPGGSQVIGVLFHDGGKIRVESKPSGAKIFINEEYVGNSPVTIHKNVGDYLVRAKKKGYPPQTVWVTVAKEKRSVVKLVLTKDKGKKGLGHKKGPGHKKGHGHQPKVSK